MGYGLLTAFLRIFLPGLLPNCLQVAWHFRLRRRSWEGKKTSRQAAKTKEETKERRARPSLFPCALAAWREVFCGQDTAHVELVGVGDILPDMSAYLDRSGYIPVPLEATYRAAWATCPADLRELVETGRLPDEEA
jgi:hypothetical protein